MAAIVTKQSLTKMLEDASQPKRALIIGRALVVLFNNQTASEQSSNVTNNQNNIGFTGADARSGCLSAKSFLKNKTLAEWQVDMWMKPGKSGSPRIAKYHAQLNAAAEMKRAAQGVLL